MMSHVGLAHGTAAVGPLQCTHASDTIIPDRMATCSSEAVVTLHHARRWPPTYVLRPKEPWRGLIVVITPPPDQHIHIELAN
jgi:hypothetical protein